MRDKILAMEAGLELDMLVGQYVIGFEDYLKETDKRPVVRDGRYGKNYFDLPNYSSDISAAWEIVENIRARGYRTHLNVAGERSAGVMDGYAELGDWHCNVISLDTKSNHIYSKTAPEAICKAALLAVIES